MKDFNYEITKLKATIIRAICKLLSKEGEEFQREFNYLSKDGRQFHVIKRYHDESFCFHNTDNHGYMFSYQLDIYELANIHTVLVKGCKGTAVVLGDLPDTYSTR